MTDLPRLETTSIPGLVVLHLDLREDARGWFKENWQREKMVALGLPDFGPVQNNISFNTRRGATRGIHTEPWDKFVAVAGGRAFCAWVDMREGDTFGSVFTIELTPQIAVFVPRGVGNSYQTLDDGVAYTYLVNEHWRPATPYPALNLADETVAVPWPIPLGSPEVEISAKDLGNPRLGEVTPMAPKRTLIIGANGQLGRALQADFPGADLVDIVDADGVRRLDLSDAAQVAEWPWHEYSLVLNAAAYTAVDAAETPEGRVIAWAANASAPTTLAKLSDVHHFTLFHYSSEYVFDGTRDEHTEGEPLSPLGVYAQSKAAGDLGVGTALRHYIVRTSWVIGDGKNFVRTMADLAAKGVSPRVVDDQIGRITFAGELSRVTRHLLDVGADHGIYNVSNGGPAMSWADWARRVFELCGRDAADVSTTTTDEYAAGVHVLGNPFAPRPLKSVMDLAKIEATGFVPEDAGVALERYLKG